MPQKCPCCTSVGLETFYDVAGIPVASNVLAATKDEAKLLPHGDLSLAACASCGFIANLAFDPATQERAAQNTKPPKGAPGPSTVRPKLRPAVGRSTFGRQGRGSSRVRQGEFMELPAGHGTWRSGSTRCSTRGGRQSGGPLDRRVVHREAPRPPADLICCRHTLEHIPAAARSWE